MAETSGRNQYFPTSVSAPGETLRELLEQRGISQADLAERTGRPRKTINEILQGKTAITPETALQLELVLGVPARFWTAREARYREFLARRAEEERLEALGEWVRQFPVREMMKRGWIAEVRGVSEKARALLEFFGVASPEQWLVIQERQAVAFRMSTAFEARATALATWLRMGERVAERRPCGEYDERRFRAALREARDLTRTEPETFQPRLEEVCAEAGVAVVFVPELPGCRTHGATKWLSPRRALLQLSLRYKTEDQLWFSFFHEAAHILLHRKRAIFLEGVNGLQDEEEAQADQFASDFLIPPEHFAALAVWDSYSHAEIVAFAQRVGVSPGIVVGRLQHERLIPFTHHNQLKTRLEWPGTETAAV